MGELARGLERPGLTRQAPAFAFIKQDIDLDLVAERRDDGPKPLGLLPGATASFFCAPSVRLLAQLLLPALPHDSTESRNRVSFRPAPRFSKEVS